MVIALVFALIAGATAAGLQGRAPTPSCFTVSGFTGFTGATIPTTTLTFKLPAVTEHGFCRA